MRLATAIVLLLLAGSVFPEDRQPQAKSATAAHTEPSKGFYGPEVKPAGSAEGAQGRGSVSQNAPISINITAPEGHEAGSTFGELLTGWGTVSLAVITLLLVIGTGFLASFTWQLWKSTTRLVEAEHDTSRRGLRAYLGISEAKVRLFGTSQIQANVLLANSGRTPATGVIRAITMEIRDAQEPGDFPMPAFKTRTMPIAPGAHWMMRYDAQVSESDYQEILSYKKAIFVWGQAQYSDIYGQRQSVAFRFRALSAHVTVTADDKGKNVRLAGPPTGWDLEPENDGNTST